MFLMLLELFGSPMFFAVILFSLNILCDYLFRALLCLAATSDYFRQFSLSYYGRNILSIDGRLSFDIYNLLK
jgi:hypothetical protein